MALSNQDIVEGMERSAAALAAVGTSVQDGLAMFSGIQEVLQNAEKAVQPFVVLHFVFVHLTNRQKNTRKI